MSNRLMAVSVVSIWLACAVSAEGAEPRIYAPGETIDPGDVAAAFMVTRKIEPRSGPASSDAVARRPIGVRIPFGFNSTAIPGTSNHQLDSIAEGIKLSGANTKVLIEGHTDAVGSDRYNVTLSHNRADAVRRYLVAKHQIPAANLKSVGLGKSTPLNLRDPFAAENRRVEFSRFSE